MATTKQYSHLFFTTDSTSTAGTSVSWLHLKNSSEQVFRHSSQELNLSIRMQTVQVGTLRRQALIYIVMVTFVVRVGWHWESRGQVQLSVKLEKKKIMFRLGILADHFILSTTVMSGFSRQGGHQ